MPDLARQTTAVNFNISTIFLLFFSQFSAAGVVAQLMKCQPAYQYGGRGSCQALTSFFLHLSISSET